MGMFGSRMMGSAARSCAGRGLSLASGAEELQDFARYYRSSWQIRT
jgi:hypothetical protein